MPCFGGLLLKLLLLNLRLRLRLLHVLHDSTLAPV